MNVFRLAHLPPDPTAVVPPLVMADLLPVIETNEHRWMRAWVARDAKALRSLTARNFVMLIGSKPPAVLDAPSWLEAATSRYLCKSYRFSDVYVRNLGPIALFDAAADVDATMDGHDWSGRIWVTDLWRKGRVRRGWRMVERIISRTDDNPQVPAAIRSLQLWR